MTLVLTAHFGDCIKILTDAASYDREGRISAIGEKITRAPDIPLVLASCGEGGLCEWVRASFLDLARCGSVDATLTKFQALLFSLHAEMCITGTFRVFIAGRADSGALFHLSASNKPPCEDVEPMELVATSHIMANGTTGDTSGLAIPLEAVDEQTFEAFALPFAELQRATTAPIPGLDEALPIRMVGGALHLTTIDDGGVETETLHTWPEDRVGAPIGAKAWHSAAMFFDVPANPSQPTRIFLRAEQIAIWNSRDGPNSRIGKPFVFQDGEFRLDAIKLREADIKNLEVDFGKIKNLKITKQLVLNGKIIDAEALTTRELAKGSITSTARGAAANEIITTQNWDDLDTFEIDNANPSPVFIQYDFKITADQPKSASAPVWVSCDLRLVRGNHVLRTDTVMSRSSDGNGGGPVSISENVFQIDMDTTGWGGGTRKYKIQARRRSNRNNGKASVQYARAQLVTWKR